MNGHVTMMQLPDNLTLRKPRGGHVVISFSFFTFPFLFLTFWFSLRHLAFRLRFRFLFFHVFYFSVFVSNFYIFTDLFRLTCQFCFDFSIFVFFFFHLLSVFVLAFKLYNENQNQNQNRQSRPPCFAGGSRWRIKVSILGRVALLTMLAQVNFLILPPLIALNHRLFFLFNVPFNSSI